MLRSVLAALFVFGTSAIAMAEEAVAASGGDSGIGKLGAAIAISVAAFGGALGQGKTAAAAVEGIARNPVAQPKIQLAMIIGLALIESLVIYALAVAFVKY